MWRRAIALLFLLGAIALGQDETDLLAKYEKDVEANHHSSITHFRIAEIYFHQHNYLSAANEFREALGAICNPSGSRSGRMSTSERFSTSPSRENGRSTNIIKHNGRKTIPVEHWTKQKYIYSFRIRVGNDFRRPETFHAPCDELWVIPSRCGPSDGLARSATLVVQGPGGARAVNFPRSPFGLPISPNVFCPSGSVACGSKLGS
jgi:hypothetical protein